MLRKYIGLLAPKIGRKMVKKITNLSLKIQVAAYEDARRGKFEVNEFAKRYNLGNPVAMQYFIAERPGGRKIV